MGKYIQGTLAFPFFFCIGFLSANIILFKWSRNFLRFGGEVISYNEKMNQKTILDVFNEIQKLNKNEKSRNNWSYMNVFLPVAETGKRSGLVQYDWFGINSRISCSRTKTAGGSSKNDTYFGSSTLSQAKTFHITII